VEAREVERREISGKGLIQMIHARSGTFLALNAETRVEITEDTE
jgi:hypothetical protein